jgi:membrane protease YdiL (CAAX protease family)
MTHSLGRRPLTGYFALAFGLTWSWLLLALGVLRLPVPVAATVGSFVGPTAAAFTMAALAEGRAGVFDLLDRYRRWRVPGRWYLLVLLGWPALFAAAALLRPGGIEAFRAPTLVVIGSVLGMFALIMVAGGPLGEEPGWRGFALPRLQQRLGPLLGALLLGALHGLWHLPVFLLVPGYNGAPADLPGTLVAFGWFVLAVTAGAVLASWVFNRTDGSLVPVVLLHTTTNVAVVVPLELFPGLPVDVDAVRLPAQLALAAVLVVATRGRLGYPRANCPDRAAARSRDHWAAE